MCCSLVVVVANASSLVVVVVVMFRVLRSACARPFVSLYILTELDIDNLRIS